MSQVTQNQDLNGGLRTCGCPATPPPSLLKVCPSDRPSPKGTDAHHDASHERLKAPEPTDTVSLATSAAFDRLSHRIPCWGGRPWTLSAVSPFSLWLILGSLFPVLSQPPLDSLSGPDSQLPRSYLPCSWGWGGSEPSPLPTTPTAQIWEAELARCLG